MESLPVDWLIRNQDVRLVLTRLDPHILAQYLHEIDTTEAQSPLSLRLHLLRLELKQVESHNAISQSSVFANTEVNLLPCKDVTNSYPRIRFGPKSKRYRAKPKSKQKPRRRRKLHHKPASAEISAFFEASEESSEEFSKIKLEVFDCETETEPLTKRKRGRPRKKPNSANDVEGRNSWPPSSETVKVEQEAEIEASVKAELDILDEMEWMSNSYSDEDHQEELVSRPNRGRKRKREAFYCEQCAYKTDSQDRLDNHREKKHPTSGEIIKCSYCDEEIVARKMEQHLYAKHKDVKLHICDQCPFKTNSLTNLTKHIDNMHLAIK